MYENWLSLTALLASLFTFIFCRNRRTGLGTGSSVCSEVGKDITTVKSDIGDSQSEIRTVTDRLNELSEQSKSVAVICRKYGTESGESE